MSKYFRFPMLVAAAGSLLVLAACGNKGPLVMPQKPVPVEEQVVEPAEVAPVEPAATPQDEAVQPAASDQGDE